MHAVNPLPSPFASTVKAILRERKRQRTVEACIAVIAARITRCAVASKQLTIGLRGLDDELKGLIGNRLIGSVTHFAWSGETLSISFL